MPITCLNSPLNGPQKCKHVLNLFKNYLEIDGKGVLKLTQNVPGASWASNWLFDLQSSPAFPSWAPSWGLLGPSWEDLGVSWKPLRRVLGTLGTLFGSLLGSFLGIPNAFRVIFGPLGSILEQLSLFFKIYHFT